MKDPILDLAAGQIRTGLLVLKSLRSTTADWPTERRAHVAGAIEYAEWAVEELEELDRKITGVDAYDPRGCVDRAQSEGRDS